MNSKVNNWAVELEQFRLHLEWIPGSWNLLADSFSCLLDVVPDAQKQRNQTTKSSVVTASKNWTSKSDGNN